MTAGRQDGLLSSSKASDSRLAVQLHPLVILTISDYVTRHILREQSGPVVGAILGAQNGRDITMEHAFECKLEERSDGNAILHPAWFHERLQQYKDVHKQPALELVGWFTLASSAGPQPHHLPIHTQLLEQYNESVLFLAFQPSSVADSSSKGGRLPLTIYESVYEAIGAEGDKQAAEGAEGAQLELRFKELPYTVETGEAEMIGVDFVARGGVRGAAKTTDDTIATTGKKKEKAANGGGGKNDSNSDGLMLLAADEERVENLTLKANAIRMLKQRISLLRKYLESVPPCYLNDTAKARREANAQISHTILRSIASLLARLPLAAPSTPARDGANKSQTAYQQETSVEASDVALVSLLGSLASLLEVAQGMGKKSSVVESQVTRNKVSLSGGPAGRFQMMVDQGVHMDDYGDDYDHDDNIDGDSVMADERPRGELIAVLGAVFGTGDEANREGAWWLESPLVWLASCCTCGSALSTHEPSTDGIPTSLSCEIGQHEPAGSIVVEEARRFSRREVPQPRRSSLSSTETPLAGSPQAVRRALGPVRNLASRLAGYYHSGHLQSADARGDLGRPALHWDSAAMGLLQNLINRSKSKAGRDETLDDEFDALPLQSNEFISRPPPLDAKVELELRKACAVILADLKPSGYDVEDTRMRSDVLIDEAEREGANYSHFEKRKTLGALVGKTSRYSNAAATTMTTTTMHEGSVPAAAPQSVSSQRNKKAVDPTRESVRLSTNTKAQIASLMAPLEGPLAPAPTNVSASRAEPRAPPQSSAANGTSPHAHAAGQGPGMVSQAAISSPIEPIAEMAGSPSQPGSKHKLISLQDAQTMRAKAAAAHRRDESTASKGPSALQPRGFRTESMTSQTSRPELGHSASASRSNVERPDMARQTTSSTSAGADVPPVPPLSSARAARAESGRLEGDAAAKVMEQKLSNGDIKDKSDEMGVVSRTRTLPSASGPDAFAKQSVARAASVSGQQQKQQQQQQQHQQQQQRVGSLTLSSTQPSHGILKNQGDANANEFGRVSGQHELRGGTARASGVTDAGSAVRGGLSKPGDPEPSDFDSLMSFMRKESQRDPTAVRQHSPSRASLSSTVSRGGRPIIPARGSSRTSSMVNTAAPKGLGREQGGSRSSTMPHMPREQQVLAMSARGATSASSPRSPLKQRFGQSNGHISDGDDDDPHPLDDHNDDEDSESPASPATAQQHTVDIVYHSNGVDGPLNSAMSDRSGLQSASSQQQQQPQSQHKDRRGLKKILWRLGGGDMPTRKKIYVPQPYQQSYSQGDFGDGYWSDEESCAAPVVAFGRGW